jgi:outer membrane receptor protein involved in Fe transport
VRQPAGEKVATTDFYQLGVSYNLSRVALTADSFLIDRSHEQVYIPDDGRFELKGPSRAYGWEAKTSMQLTHRLSFNGGLTQVMNAFYRATSPRQYVDSAPHTVANAGLTLSAARGFSGSLRYRHASGYRLDPLDTTFRAHGVDVIDLSASKHLRHGVEVSVAIDNLNNKRYWETQNLFQSQLGTKHEPLPRRIHATPGYPIGLTLGLTYRLGEK